MSNGKIPDPFHPAFVPYAKEQCESVNKLTMHEYLEKNADYIESNESSEFLQILQPDVMREIAKVLKNRYESGWSLEDDYMFSWE